MTDDPYPPLRPQPRLREPRRRTPWIAIGGVVLLAVLAVALLIAFLSRGDDPASAGSPSPSASASTDPPESTSPGETAEATAEGSATPAASASAPATGFEADTIVATTVDRLSVRDGPSTAAERLGSLAEGTPSFVVAGPTMADGYPWYLVSALGLPPNSGCAGPFETDPFNCPAWFGWVAGANQSGAPWLATTEPECPEEPLTAEGVILGRTAIERLACFGADPFTFRAFWPEIPDDAGLGGACAAQDTSSGWLLCQNINYDTVTIDESEGFGGVGVRVSIDPASGVVMPERGTWIEITVHLDDPAAQSCDEDAEALGEDRPAEQWVLECRAELVVESAIAVDGP